MVMVASVEVESPACPRSGPLPPPQGGGAARRQPREWAGRPRGKNLRGVVRSPRQRGNEHSPDQQGRKCFVTGINQHHTSIYIYHKQGHYISKQYESALNDSVEERVGGEMIVYPDRCARASVPADGLCYAMLWRFQG